MKEIALLLIFLALFLVPAAIAFKHAKTELEVNQQISMATFSTALCAYVALAGGIVLNSWLHVWPVPITDWISRTSGAAFLLAGAIVYLTARLQLRSFRQTWALRTDKLLTAGIYRVLRHPQNLGWGLLLAGVALLGRSGVALILTGVYIVTCLIWLPFEEAFLARRFGSSYTRYRRETPALVRFRESSKR